MLNLKKIPQSIKEALYERELTDAEIEQLSPEEAFRHYCEWHGLINWADTLVHVIDTLRSSKMHRG